MDANAIAGWWGAILATIVFVWEIFKWSRSGARLAVSATPNMQRVLPGSGLDHELLVSVVVRNIGDAPTTITHLMGYVFAPRWLGISKRRVTSFAITPGPMNRYPHVLEPGATWTAWVPQSELERVLAKGPIIHVGVHHSMSERALTVPVSLKGQSGAEPRS